MFCRNKKNLIINRVLIVAIVIITCISLLSGCVKSHDVSKESAQINEYVLNSRSKKIHSVDCQYVGRIKETNKKAVSDSLINLLKNDYTICRKCKAGVKESLGNSWFNHLFHNNLYQEMEVDASKEDYLNSINEMGEWYVEHISTYASLIQEEAIEKYTGEFDTYKEYLMPDKNGTEKAYKVISSDKGGTNINSIDSSTKILRANETAAINYLENYESIIFEKKIAYYPCDLLDEKSDYNMPGDDCVRFVFSILNRMEGNFTEKFKLLTKKSYNHTNSKMLTTDRQDIAFGMINLGFQIFDSEESSIFVGKDNNPEGYIHEITDDFQLENGDIICREGHVHLYLGDGNMLVADNFGWGRVYRYYPWVYEISVQKEPDGKNKVILINSAGEEEAYSRVYRFIGQPEGE